MPDFMKAAGATPSQVWEHGNRSLTELTGKPRTDLVGQDNSLEATTGTRVAKIDNVDTVISTRSLETGGRLDSIPAFLVPDESSVLVDGTEKTLFEITDVKPGEFEAWIDLSPMQDGDTIVVRYFRKMKAAGNYVKYAEETYSGAQSLAALCIISKKIYRDIKVTAQQTLGSYKTLDCQVIMTRTV